MGHYTTYLLRGGGGSAPATPCPEMLSQNKPSASSTIGLSGTNRWRAWYYPVDATGRVTLMKWGIRRNSDAGRQFVFYAWSHATNQPGTLLATSSTLLSADLPDSNEWLDVPLEFDVTAGSGIWVGMSYNLISMTGAATVSMTASQPVGFNRGLYGGSTAGPWYNSSTNSPAWCQLWSGTP